jgi:hypothetical protein
MLSNNRRRGVRFRRNFAVSTAVHHLGHVYLGRQHGAFHGTNPEPGWQYSATRARPSPQPSHDEENENDPRE